MNRFDMNSRSVFLLTIGLLMTACATYYEVKDPTTGKTYYTQEIKRDGSASMFKDARSGSEVTIQNSEVKEIDGNAFDAGLKTPVSKPSPTPSAAPDQGSSPAESSK